MQSNCVSTDQLSIRAVLGIVYICEIFCQFLNTEKKGEFIIIMLSIWYDNFLNFCNKFFSNFTIFLSLKSPNFSLVTTWTIIV